MYAEVETVEELSRDLVRVVLTGGTLDQFEASDATDAYINARFIPEDSPVSVPFEPEDLDGLAAEHRPRPRRFTIRSWNPKTLTLSIDFVVHGDAGFAGSWAKRARPGDRLQFEGPGGSYRPSSEADWHLLAGDESAFGAIGASLESLPAHARAVVLALVDRPGCEIDFPTAADVTVKWLYREGAENPDDVLVDSIANTSFPDGRFDVFVHGEAAEVRAIRSHLDDDRQIEPIAASISPYWRRDHSDEDWRKVKRQFMSGERAGAS